MNLLTVFLSILLFFTLYDTFFRESILTTTKNKENFFQTIIEAKESLNHKAFNDINTQIKSNKKNVNRVKSKIDDNIANYNKRICDNNKYMDYSNSTEKQFEQGVIIKSQEIKSVIKNGESDMISIESCIPEDKKNIVSCGNKQFECLDDNLAKINIDGGETMIKDGSEWCRFDECRQKCEIVKEFCYEYTNDELLGGHVTDIGFLDDCIIPMSNTCELLEDNNLLTSNITNLCPNEKYFYVSNLNGSNDTYDIFFKDRYVEPRSNASKTINHICKYIVNPIHESNMSFDTVQDIKDNCFLKDINQPVLKGYINVFGEENTYKYAIDYHYDLINCKYNVPQDNDSHLFAMSNNIDNVYLCNKYEIDSSNIQVCSAHNKINCKKSVYVPISNQQAERSRIEIYEQRDIVGQFKKSDQQDTFICNPNIENNIIDDPQEDIIENYVEKYNRNYIENVRDICEAKINDKCGNLEIIESSDKKTIKCIYTDCPSDETRVSDEINMRDNETLIKVNEISKRTIDRMDNLKKNKNELIDKTQKTIINRNHLNEKIKQESINELQFKKQIKSIEKSESKMREINEREKLIGNKLTDRMNKYNLKNDLAVFKGL